MHPMQSTHRSHHNHASAARGFVARGPKLFWLAFGLMLGLATPAFAATNLSFTVNLSENVTVDTTGGTPSIAIDVGGATRQATYMAGSGTNALTFGYTAQAGDLDLDGIGIASPIQLNGGTMKDAVGNNAVLTFTPPNTTGVKVDHPSLSMDFTADADGTYIYNGTTYGALSGLLTATGGSFTRNSIATYYDSSGVLRTASANAPRFDHDPATLAAKGILIEESRTNLLRYSEQIDNAAWAKNAGTTVTANAATAPDGTTTADYVNSSGYVLQTYSSVTIGDTYTFSVWLRTASGTASVPIFIEGTVNGDGNFLIANTNAAVTSQWQRFTLSATVPAGYTTNFRPGPRAGAYYMWGAQLERANAVSSYIPTTTASVVREADILNVPMQSAMGVTAGTAFIDANLGRAGFQITGVTRWQDILGVTNNGNSGFARNMSGNIITVPNLTGKTKLVSAYGNNNSYTIANGGSLNTGSGGIPNFSSNSVLRLGTKFDNAEPFINDTIRIFKYYPSLPNTTQLQLLTQ